MIRRNDFENEYMEIFLLLCVFFVVDDINILLIKIYIFIYFKNLEIKCFNLIKNFLYEEF